jgi:hypothetical protein
MTLRKLLLGTAALLLAIGSASASNLPQLPLGRWQDSNGSNLILKKDGYFFAEDCKIIKAKVEPSQAGVFNMTLRCQMDGVGLGGPYIAKEKWLVDTIDDKKFLIIVRDKFISHLQYEGPVE